jgi:penicillin-binding protein 1C
MQFLHAKQPSHAPKAPPGVMQAPVQFASTEAARSEWFLQGTQQASFAIDSRAPSAYSAGAGGKKGRITSPTTGTIIALDPDIPPNRQRVSFEATGTGVRWLLDGKPMAKGASAQWLPWPGRHVVQLADARGQVLDEVRLEVRGAGVRATRTPRGLMK